ncbi:glycerol-3-phosphate acyltransferase [Atopobium deltae]|uniref:Glycerol-3-phosphate acyltransferase n=1 Tax=Atopobium deltae TaxID=1393034 RepID=A0A133XS74_9ACTN|nr:glycerol-3-phosphate acyltransferase [Atopobium deltae]KXB33778.1 acyl-phosphate glycerol 3-phosphate acyltransferase [Atopobium deltae]
MDPVVLTIVLMLAAYFICGIPFGLIICSCMTHADIRSMGSGNIGSTNVGRSVGAKAAALTLAADTIKAIACSVAARVIVMFAFGLPDAAATMPSGAYGWIGAAVCVAGVCGHIFSPYLGFKGGKGIAAGFGAMIGFAPLVAVGLLAVFLAIILPTRLISAGSVAAAASLPFWTLFLYQAKPEVFGLISFVAFIVIWAHRNNLKKLLTGQEKRFSFHHEVKGE